jgi:drug/metabolite transporter (DMT)-like permease
MQDTELFLSLAEIAGMFVGFGALIAVRSGGPMEASEINTIRWPVTIAIWVVIVALAPVIISRYEITGHELWFACSLLALALLAIMIAVFARTPENRADVAHTFATMPAGKIALLAGPTFWLPCVLDVLALLLVVLGPFPDQEPALYLTAVGLGLLMGALGLFVGVFSPRSARSASDSVELPATGGSIA